MEKFAVDLDRVLDEFEFNEDCAEQVALSLDTESPWSPQSLSKPSAEASSSLNYSHVSSSSGEDGNALPERSNELPRSEEKISNLDAMRIDDSLDIRKMSRSKRENHESVNDFYTRGKNAMDDKIQTKRYANFRDGEPVSLTIRNDISQKLSHKQQNEAAGGVSSIVKNQNSYDKKLNQPNIKPSVSNVFSSLNDYINAPSGNLECNDNAIVPCETAAIRSEREIKALSKVDGGEETARALSKDRSFSREVTFVPGFKESQPVDKSRALLPKYENILLPVKLENSETRNFSACTSAQATITPYSEVPSSAERISDEARNTNDLAVPEIVAGTIQKRTNSCSPAGPKLPAASTEAIKEAKTTERTEAHHYENVLVAEPTRDVVEVNAIVGADATRVASVNDEASRHHSYENVDTEKRTRESEAAPVYERLCASESGDLTGDVTRSNNAEPRATTSRFQDVASKVTEKEAAPVVGFNATIDDLSEEELNRYLAELEAEERANEGKLPYENVGSSGEPRENGTLRRVPASTRKLTTEDEDANEAPIFETVTIGVLPALSEETLQEKAKKFPVIDYGKSQRASSSETSADFLDESGPESFPARINCEAAAMGERVGDEVASNVAIPCDETHLENTESRTGLEENASPLPSHDKVRDLCSTEQIIEASLHRDNTCAPVNDTAMDVSLQNPEILNAEHVSVEFEDDRMVEGTAANEESPKIQPEAPKNDGAIGNVQLIGSLPETNAKPDVRQDCNDTKDDKAGSELPTSSDNIFSSREESAKEAEGSDPEDKLTRPQTLDIVSTVSIGDETIPAGDQEVPGVESDSSQQQVEPPQDISENFSIESSAILGKQPPFWIPDNEAPNCMLCDVKFTVIKRRHHCRACGKVLCNKCCSMKYRLQYQVNIDSRVCSPCYQLLVKVERDHESGDCSSTCANSSPGNINSSEGRQPNPNNPMEYCSTIPPLQQLAGGLPPPPTVMVPVGVLKREGSSKQRPEGQKSVMFSDGIRPGCDLTELDTSWDLKPPYRKIGKRGPPSSVQSSALATAKRQNMPPMDPNTNCYIPQDPDALPPMVTIHKGEITYHEPVDSATLYKSLKNECEPPVMFAINRNLYAYVKITNLNCCVNRVCWNVTSRGLACVGQDEIIFLVETLPDETQIPKDLLVHINHIYIEAIKGNTITELGVSIYQRGHFLGSREHAGFLFVRQSFQCLQKIILPPAPFLVGLLVHRWETPWAKVFPLRLMLRLGAEYRYYPCPLVSVRFRDAVYFEIGHTIMKVLADFRNFAYTLPGVRGLTIHMQDRTTDVLFPKNRYDQVIKGLNNSNDHVLAFAANFSSQADSHLVCIQTNTGDESSYQTQAINIHNKPRKVTGASFVVINGALKSSMGLSAKSSIVEDGLMVQIMPEKMEALKAALKNMHDFSIGCGLQGAPEPDETVNIKWVDNDELFNLGVKSPIDGKAMDGIPSIRVHNGTDYMGPSRFIRWTEVFIIKSDDHPAGVHDPVDINKLSESIARATCAAFVKLLDLLATAGLTKIAVRTTIHPDNVGYEAGSEGTRLPPIYMNSLDNELIQVLHKAAQMSQDTNTVLELIFHVLDD